MGVQTPDRRWSQAPAQGARRLSHSPTRRVTRVLSPARSDLPVRPSRVGQASDPGSFSAGRHPRTLLGRVAMLGPPAGFKSRGRPARWLQEWGAARPLASGSPEASGGAGAPRLRQASCCTRWRLGLGAAGSQCWGLRCESRVPVHILRVFPRRGVGSAGCTPPSWLLECSVLPAHRRPSQPPAAPPTLPAVSLAPKPPDPPDHPANPGSQHPSPPTPGRLLSPPRPGAAPPRPAFGPWAPCPLPPASPLTTPGPFPTWFCHWGQL